MHWIATGSCACDEGEFLDVGGFGGPSECKTCNHYGGNLGSTDADLVAQECACEVCSIALHL